MKLWFVYVMNNKPKGVIYVGVTDNLEERIKEHKLKLYPKSFTAKYNCDKLIYFEEFENDQEAMIREKRLKKWKREWKVKLIETMNPGWMDLSMNWSLNYKKFRIN
jgi:putative endonuclease